MPKPASQPPAPSPATSSRRTPARARGHLRQKLKTAYRDAILDAAEGLLARRGFEETKMSAVAEAAGVATGTVYNYFTGQEELFEAVMERCRDKMAATLAPAMSESDPMRRLKAIVTCLFKFVDGHRELAMIRQRNAARGSTRLARHEDEEEAVDHVTKALIATVDEAQQSGALRNDIDPLLLSGSLSGLIEAHFVHWLQRGGDAPLADQASNILKIFQEGASTP